MQSVMNVIMNRSGGDFSKADDVVLKRKQFSAWNNISSPKSYAMSRGPVWVKKQNKEFLEALHIVDLARKNSLTDITGGAKYYYNPKKARPSWAKKMKKTTKIGNHVFYK